MDPQDLSSPSFHFSRAFSSQNLAHSGQMFFERSRNPLKQANSLSKESKLESILQSLRAFKNSHSTTDFHSQCRTSQNFYKGETSQTSQHDKSLPSNKITSNNPIKSHDHIKHKLQINSPQKIILQSGKKEENSHYSHFRHTKNALPGEQLKKVKQSEIITSHNDLSRHTSSTKNIHRQLSPNKIFSIEMQKSSLQAIKQKLQKYGINAPKNTESNQSRVNLNRSEKYPQNKKYQKSITELRLASSGQFSPNLIKGIKDKFKEEETQNQQSTSSRPLSILKEPNLPPADRFIQLTTPHTQINSSSVRNFLIENNQTEFPTKKQDSNSVSSANIHSNFFNLNIQNFVGSKLHSREPIAPKKSGSYDNQKPKLSQSQEYGTGQRQKPGSWGNKKFFKQIQDEKQSFYINPSFPLNDRHDPNLKQTIETNCSVQKIQRKLIFKDFILGRQIGKGKFGRVYICTHRETGFISAIKIIKKEMIRKQRSIEQLIRQIKIQTYVHHCQSVKMYAFFDDSENIYLLMEYCVDGQLYALLKTKKRFEEDEAVPIIKDICEALKHLHEQNIIHRDIKPENVVMSFQLSKLCDFGWSVNSQNQKRQTFCGTPLYVSPQLLMGKTYDYKVDIWALGIMVYELLTGKLPFQITNENQLRKIVTSEVKYPEHLSENAKNFIQHLLQKNPSYRNDTQTILKHNFLVEGLQKHKAKLNSP